MFRQKPQNIEEYYIVENWQNKDLQREGFSPDYCDGEFFYYHKSNSEIIDYLKKEKPLQVIKNPAEARKLLKLGNPIVDIRPKNEIGKEGETAFFFEKTNKLYQDLNW